MNNIYAYWNGPNRHWYYDMCWETVTRRNPNAVLLSKNDVEDVLGPFPNALNGQYVVHACDWIRKAFIHKVGGAWVDMDFICWSDLSWLSSAANSFDYVGWKEWHGTGWMDNLFAACKGSPVMLDAANYALSQMEQHGQNVAWLATNAHAMNHALAKHPWCRYLQIPTHVIAPIGVMDVGDFIKDAWNTDVMKFASAGVMTSMHGIGSWLGSFRGPDELLKSKSVTGAFMRRAFDL